MSLSSPSSSTVSLADSSSIRSSSASTDPSLFSSGLTTPADDCSQPFYNVAACSPTLGCKEDPAQCDEMATPKPLFLSKGFRQATRFAQNLVTPKSKRVKSMAVSTSAPKVASPSLIHTVRGPFGMQRGIDKAKRIFSLPNDPIRPNLKRRPALSSAVRSPVNSQQTNLLTSLVQCRSPALNYADGIIPGQNTPVVDGSDPAGTFPGKSMSVNEPVVTPSAPSQFGAVPIMILVAKIICFLPWCLAVGATLLLAPQYSELVAFRTGYVSSLQGVRRFAHWAECGLQQVTIFFASIAIIGYFQMAVGVTLAVLVLSRFIFVWQNFEFDQSIPLGEDDRQSLYRIAMLENYGLDRNTVICTKAENGETFRSAIAGGGLTTVS